MSNFNKNINKYKKYAFRKIGKYFGPCVIGTMISLGVAVTLPSNNAHASFNGAGEGKPEYKENITSAEEGYEVFVPKGKKYERDDTVESHTPVLKEKGHNGRSFILKAEENDDTPNLTKEDIDNHFGDNPMESLFEKLYDEDDDGEIDAKYKRADADTINENAGKPINGSQFVEPKVSEVNPKYPHRLDAGVATPAKPGNLYEGRPAEANGDINSDDTIVESNKPITVNPNSEENIVNDDGTVVLSKYYRIHVNEGDTADKVDDIYVVGTKPKVEEKEIPFTTRYVEDNTKDKDYRETTQAGVKGKEITTTTYTMDPNNGTVTENTPTVVREEPKEEIITVGTKPKVEEKELPFTTRYVEDKTKDKDYRETTQVGVKGKETTTTTYTMNPTDGTVTENTPTVVREEPKEEIITVGTKPKVVEKELPFTTRYVEDKTKDKDYRETTQVGVKGKETTTTTYTMDPNNGTVTENTPTVVREEPKEEIITVGTKPKVVEKELPFTTRYVEDNTKDKDYRETTQVGVKGKETITTTYTMNPTDGTVTENTPTVVREEPKEEIITVGTKPKVVETLIPYTTRYVEDNTKDKDYRETTQAGVKGKETTTTTYTMDPNNGTVTENTPTVVREEPKEEIITVGTKPKVVEKELPFTTRYVEDNTKDKDYRETTQVGVKGKETTTTTYTMDPNNGTVTENTPTVVREEPKEEIITVGTKPKVVETPETPQPEKPGETPETPQPETTGTKEVTRTIKYVDEKGNEVEKSSTDKVKFTRESTNADWKAVDGDDTFDKVSSPVVKGYILKDPAQKVVEKETVKSDAKDEIITVTYTKVGSYIPKVPEGVTPPSPTPYDNDPEDPTKVVTQNPEKPQDPKDPNSPKVPVIPQVPGHTPIVPKDPTKPVSPENPLVPLTPVDPNHPEKGYNVPPVPTTPGQDTPIEYVKDGQQKVITSFVDPKGNVLETPITETGDSNTPLIKDGEIKATIAKLKLKGYDVETNTYPPKGAFDNDPKVDQYFKVTLTPRVKPVKPFDPTNPKDPNKPVPGQPIDPDTPVDPNNPNDPTIPRWTDELINKLETTKQVTRTIKYVDEKGNEVEKSSTDKVTFTREAKINVVTGEITYGDWKAVGGDDTFDKVSSPVVKGYILKDPAQKVVEKETVKSDAKDETITVTYTKVGSYVPKVPEGVTPKTPLTPTPYDNDPEDPTKVITPNPEKPQDPQDPNSPKVPVLPQVPGHTPVVPKDPTKPVSPENPLVPLTPVDPNHPEKGYNVPPVPTTPGQDTPIEYVKDGQQRAIVNFVDENGNSVVASILQTGKAGDKFTKDTLVKSTISELQSKGYELRTSDYPKEGTGVFDNDSKVDQIFTVTVRKIEVLPPRPRVIERPGGNTVVEVGVPNKDADKLNIWYIKRNNPTAPKEEIVTKKDNGTWKIEKAPEGVTINPSTGIVSIPGNKIQPKTWIDTQTKHETKISKIVSVMPNIHDLTEFEGITMWIEDKERTNLKDPVDGVHERGEFTGYEWKESILEGNIITHIFKKLSNPDNPKFETGINVLPPTPKIVERPGGGGTVEVGVPNKDADTLIIKYTKRNNPNDPKEEIITKKDKDGTWKIEKSPDGVTINPTTGVVYIPSKQIEPKTFVDTQTKHGDKPSKVVSVVPNISELKEFKGITEWIDVNGNTLKPSEEGIHEKGRFDNLVWLESVLEGNKITHIFGPGTPTVDKPEYKVTVWFDKDGNPIKPDQPGTHESGKIPGYRFITTTTKDGVTVHKFEKITPVAPNKPTPENPNTPNPEKQQVKKLANTGATETNTGLAGLGLAMFGMALTAIKRRKQK